MSDSVRKTIDGALPAGSAMRWSPDPDRALREWMRGPRVRRPWWRRLWDRVWLP